MKNNWPGHGIQNGPAWSNGSYKVSLTHLSPKRISQRAYSTLQQSAYFLSNNP